MFGWVFQRVSGIALAVILALHFVVIHFTSSGNIDYASVMTRMASPFWKGLDLGFLYLALFHSVNGFKILIDDYIHQPVLRLVLESLNWLLAFVLAVYGSLIILSFSAPGV